MARSQDQLSELLSAYLDGEVTAREKAEVEEILRRDSAAKRLLDELRQTSAMIAGLPRHGAPPDLAATLDAQLERVQLLSGLGEIRGDTTPAAPSRFTWLKAAAMLMLVVGGGWWFLSLQQSKSTSVAMKDGSLPSLTDAKSPTAATTPPRPVEDLLASGADPAVLLTQSFEVEPLRVQVVARNESDRDEIKRKLSGQFAQVKAENLASRAVPGNAERQVGAFYLEGKPGVNFKDSNERQILVRLPQSRADQLIESVMAGGKVADDQIALQVGSATVQGPDKARAMLQMMASNDEALPAPAVEAEPRTARSQPSTEAKERGKPEGLLKTLSDIVGVTPATSGRSTTATTDADLAVANKPGSIDPAAGASEKMEPTVDPTKPLVDRRLEAARSSAGNEETAALRPPEAMTPAAPMRRASASGSSDPFITIVIELGVASPKPPPRNENNRSRS